MEPYALLLGSLGCVCIGTARTAVWMLNRRDAKRRSNYRAFVMVETAKREVRRVRA